MQPNEYTYKTNSVSSYRLAESNICLPLICLKYEIISNHFFSPFIMFMLTLLPLDPNTNFIFL